MTYDLDDPGYRKATARFALVAAISQATLAIVLGGMAHRLDGDVLTVVVCVGWGAMALYHAIIALGARKWPKHQEAPREPF